MDSLVELLFISPLYRLGTGHDWLLRLIGQQFQVVHTPFFLSGGSYPYSNCTFKSTLHFHTQKESS